jgi:hypothetical protein
MNTHIDRTVPRPRAAEIIGVTAGTLRNWACGNPPRGPRPVKTTASRQGRTLYSVAEITAWQADPAAYERRAWADRGRRRDRSRPR